MPTTFTPISLEEMQSFLEKQKFHRLHPGGVNEAVFGRRCDRANIKLTLRIYTGIEGADSRNCGKDAIRATLFHSDTENGKLSMVTGTRRVHRVRNWKKNLQKRIDELLAFEPLICSRCGMVMTKRKGRYGEFYGCTGYPQCSNTEKIL